MSSSPVSNNIELAAQMQHQQEMITMTPELQNFIDSFDTVVFLPINDDGMLELENSNTTGNPLHLPLHPTRVHGDRVLLIPLTGNVTSLETQLIIVATINDGDAATASIQDTTSIFEVANWLIVNGIALSNDCYREVYEQVQQLSGRVNYSGHVQYLGQMVVQLSDESRPANVTSEYLTSTSTTSSESSTSTSTNSGTDPSFSSLSSISTISSTSNTPMAASSLASTTSSFEDTSIESSLNMNTISTINAAQNVAEVQGDDRLESNQTSTNADNPRWLEAAEEQLHATLQALEDAEIIKRAHAISGDEFLPREAAEAEDLKARLAELEQLMDLLHEVELRIKARATREFEVMIAGEDLNAREEKMEEFMDVFQEVVLLQRQLQAQKALATQQAVEAQLAAARQELEATVAALGLADPATAEAPLEQHLAEAVIEDCAICMDEMPEGFCRAGCGHKFGLACMLRWLDIKFLDTWNDLGFHLEKDLTQVTCPLCRIPITVVIHSFNREGTQCRANVTKKHFLAWRLSDIASRESFAEGLPMVRDSEWNWVEASTQPSSAALTQPIDDAPGSIIYAFSDRPLARISTRLSDTVRRRIENDILGSTSGHTVGSICSTVLKSSYERIVEKATRMGNLAAKGSEEREYIWSFYWKFVKQMTREFRERALAE